VSSPNSSVTSNIFVLRIYKKKTNNSFCWHWIMPSTASNYSHDFRSFDSWTRGEFTCNIYTPGPNKVTHPIFQLIHDIIIVQSDICITDGYLKSIITPKVSVLNTENCLGKLRLYLSDLCFVCCNTWKCLRYLYRWPKGKEHIQKETNSERIQCKKNEDSSNMDGKDRGPKISELNCVSKSSRTLIWYYGMSLAAKCVEPRNGALWTRSI
jgi:hypothetical protein